jgi:hypothetical protein
VRLLAAFAAILFCAASAAAEPARPIAPSLTPALLHQRIQEQLDIRMRELPTATQRRLVGTYVAFDPDLTQAYALVSCDDDGDHVIVISDAMIELAQRVAEAAADDEINGTQKLSLYGSTLASQTASNVRLLPPPAGFYEGTHDYAREGELFDEAMHGIVSQELARLVRGHLVCPRPTPAHETADDVWTPAERAYAFKLEGKLYDAEHNRDADATSLDWVRGRSTGYVALLRVMATIENGPGRGAVPWIRLHPNAAARASSVKASETQGKSL